MEIVNMHQAKTHLSRLARRAAAGESVIIAAGGKPLAKLVPLSDGDAKPAPRRLGFMEGEFTVPDDYGTMMEKEIEAMFHGEDQE